MQRFQDVLEQGRVLSVFPTLFLDAFLGAVGSHFAFFGHSSSPGV